jgi:TRAP-type C4-dicarboxylate transport system substrate-binding protein
MAHRPTWQRLPDDIKSTIERNVAAHVRQQRADQAALNASLRHDLARRGLMFNEVNQAAFRARLAGVYATWRERLGARCWALLEDEVGSLG